MLEVVCFNLCRNQVQKGFKFEPYGFFAFGMHISML